MGGASLYLYLSVACVLLVGVLFALGAVLWRMGRGSERAGVSRSVARRDP
jgi:hypothetical protein